MKEIKPFLELVVSIILGAIIIPLGIAYNFGKSIYHLVRLKPLMAIGSFLGYWLMFLYQIWNVIKYLSGRMAVCIDLLGNATSGEMIEDCVTTEEDTLYGQGNVTISAATGELETKGKLNKVGIWFTNMLSFCLGKNHSIDAYKKYLFNK